MRPSGLWFRLWCSVLNSQKLQSLPAETFRQWVNFGCIAKEQDGFLPSDSCLAFRVRKTESQVRKWLDELIKAGLVDVIEGRCRLHDWDEWQNPDDYSTERVRDFRKRKREVKRDETVDETEKRFMKRVSETPCNVSRNANETLDETRAEQSREEKREEKPPPPPFLEKGGAIDDSQSDALSSGAYEFFCREYIGEVPQDLWQRFGRYVNGHLGELVTNLPLWMRTRKYAEGYGGNGEKFLRSGVWRAPPREELNSAKRPQGGEDPRIQKLRKLRALRAK